jgi:hypothetical protein
MHFGDETVQKLDCGHLLHDKCIAQVIQCAASESNIKCPLCRAPLLKRQTSTCQGNIRIGRDWLEMYRIEIDWVTSIESAHLEEQINEMNMHQIERGYGLRNLNVDPNHSGNGIAFDRGSAIHSVHDRRQVLPRAHAIWQEYQEQLTTDTAAATLRAQSAWKAYEDHMQNEIDEYEANAVAAWLEEENRIEIGRMAMESEYALTLIR